MGGTMTPEIANQGEISHLFLVSSKSRIDIFFISTLINNMIYITSYGLRE